ncbi:MAG: exosortase A [Pseudomonadota bacterium]
MQKALPDGIIAFPAARPLDQGSSIWPRAAIAFALLAATLGALFSDAAFSMASIWFGSSVYHHCAIAAPISLFLILRRRDWRRSAPSADWLGVLFIVFAGALLFASRASGISIIGHAALVVALIGAVVAIFGRDLSRRWAFPLGFLFFMVPFGEEAIPLLQQSASAAVAAMLNLTGVETLREGFILTTSAGRFEMARSCAGLRFLLAAAMISALVSHLAFSTLKKRAAFVAAALAVAIAANWLRAYVIIFAATVSGRRFGIGPEHVALGWAFYSMLIIALIALARRMADPPRSALH